MSQLDALAADLAVKGRASSDQCVENVPEGSNFSGGLQAVEPSIRVPPRPSNFEHDPFVSDGPLIGRRKVLTLASLFMAAVIGVGVAFAWHSYSAWTMKSPNDVDVAAGQSGSTPAAPVSASDTALPQSVPGTQTAAPPTGPATSPELVKQLEAMTQDLTFVRRTVEQLAAKQEQLAAAQQQLEQLAAKQEQLAAKQEQLTAKQEQMAQNIAKLPTREQNVRQKTSPPPQSRAAPIPPRTPPEPAAQLSSVPRSAPHPVPPLPVPP